MKAAVEVRKSIPLPQGVTEDGEEIADIEKVLEGMLPLINETALAAKTKETMPCPTGCGDELETDPLGISFRFHMKLKHREICDLLEKIGEGL